MMRKPLSDFISINGHTIRTNAARGTNLPPIRVARGRNDKAPRMAHEVVINGPSRLCYDPGRALLNCGARLVIEAAPGSVEIVS